MMLTHVPLSNEINSNAPVVCSRTIQIDTDIQSVWSILTNVNAWSTWQSDISDSELKEPLAPGASFLWKSGGTRIRSTVHSLDYCRSIGWTGKAAGTRAIHNWTLSELNGHTELVVEESMEGPMAHLLRKYLQKTLDRGMQLWLELLKKECEK